MRSYLTVLFFTASYFFRSPFRLLCVVGELCDYMSSTVEEILPMGCSSGGEDDRQKQIPLDVSQLSAGGGKP